jgi:4-hydroxybutyrate dehydrogenase
MTTLLFGTPVHFGFGLSSMLPGELKKLNSARPLFVADKGVVAAGVFARATKALGDAGTLHVFDDVPVNPNEAAALAGAEMYRALGCDAVVGIGGGASLDLAKAIAVLATNAPPLWNYCNRHPKPAAIVDAPPLVLMPTTSGTGSEVGRSAVIVFNNGIKAGVRCPDIVSVAICDPELTMGLPSRVTATTGMDALSHCIETYCSAAVNPPADAIALDGMERVFRYLETAVADGTHRDARWNMMMGSLEGAMCFQKGLGAVHALSHPLGALGFHHGTLNAILLPHVLAYNQEWLGEKAAMIASKAEAPAGRALDEVIHRLNRAIGIPATLEAIGISEASLDDVAAQALDDNAHKTNPRPMQKSDYLAVLAAAYR